MWLAVAVSALFPRRDFGKASADVLFRGNVRAHRGVAADECHRVERMNGLFVFNSMSSAMLVFRTFSGGRAVCSTAELPIARWQVRFLNGSW